MIEALSKVLKVPIEQLIEEIGYSGMELEGKRGFHPQEFIAPAFKRGLFMIQIESEPRLISGSLGSGLPLIEEVRRKHDGIMLGLSTTGTRHAWASIGGQLIDTLGRQLAQIDYYLAFASSSSESYEFT